MADPVEQRVIDSVKTALEGITITGGYYQSVGAVHVMTGDVLKLPVMPACVVLHQGLEARRGGPNNLQTCFLSIVVWAAIAMEPDWQVAITRLATDVAKALRVDWTRGEIAVDTTIQSTDVSNESDAFPVAVAQVSAQVHFRHLYHDPTAPA